VGPLRSEAAGAHVGEVLVADAGCLGADALIRVFGLRMRGAPALLQVRYYARPHSPRAIRSGSFRSQQSTDGRAYMFTCLTIF
jgi:hypothetical protein